MGKEEGSNKEISKRKRHENRHCLLWRNPQAGERGRHGDEEKRREEEKTEQTKRKEKKKKEAVVVVKATGVNRQTKTLRVPPGTKF